MLNQVFIVVIELISKFLYDLLLFSDQIVFVRQLLSQGLMIFLELIKILVVKEDFVLQVPYLLSFVLFEIGQLLLFGVQRLSRFLL